jgi:hypothetical protein
MARTGARISFPLVTGLTVYFGGGSSSMLRFAGPENICPSIFTKLLLTLGLKPSLKGSFCLYDVGNLRSAEESEPPGLC